MSALANETEPVDLADLTRQLRLSHNTRSQLLKQRLVTPLREPRPGRTTWITPEDAEQLRQAVKVAAVTGIAVVIVLKVLQAQ